MLLVVFFIILAVILIVLTMLFVTEKDKSTCTLFLVLAAVCLIMAGYITGSQYAEGKPVGITYFSSRGILPPEDIPTVIIAVAGDNNNSTESIAFILAPYNDREKIKFYRTPQELIEPGTNLSVGARVINNNGKIQNN